jgi:hypothetical protein
MRVVARSFEWQSCPPEIASVMPPGQLFVTTDREYEIYGMSVYLGVVYLQMVDDLGDPSWVPDWFFDVVEPTVPGDWVCALPRGGLRLILGPAFVARDKESYRSMVELEPDQLKRFWARVGPGQASGQSVD